MITLTAIGIVRSPLNARADCPRQEHEGAPEAIIEVFAFCAEAAADIQPGDQLLLLTWLDKADRAVQKTHPRNDEAAPLTGVFATRSPDRPNPIGVHWVKVKSRVGLALTVDALEVLNGTLVLDIKSA
jgi:tRNA-Thr(GGU) m(6)t(6)A37 methyltransferase TsaA